MRRGCAGLDELAILRRVRRKADVRWNSCSKACAAACRRDGGVVAHRHRHAQTADMNSASERFK